MWQLVGLPIREDGAFCVFERDTIKLCGQHADRPFFGT